jgi:hypothetical protein
MAQSSRNAFGAGIRDGRCHVCGARSSVTPSSELCGRILSSDQALALANEVERALVNHEHDVVMHDVVMLALRSGCSAYNCEYVALAQGLGVPLVTFDREVLRAFPDLAIAPEAFLRD